MFLLAVDFCEFPACSAQKGRLLQHSERNTQACYGAGLRIQEKVISRPRNLCLQCKNFFNRTYVPHCYATAHQTVISKVTQIFMMSVLFNPMVESGIAPDTAWRLAMIVPAVMFLIVALSLKLLCWDTPTARRMSHSDIKGVPKIWGTILGVPIIMLAVFWGILGFPYFGKLP